MAEDDSGIQPVADSDSVAHRWELALWLAVRQTRPNELSHGAKLCWNVIARFEQHGMECWAGLMRMGHQVGVTEGQASRYMTELFKRGYARRAVGKKGKPIYQRLTPPDLRVRAEKMHQELQARSQKNGDD